MKFRANYVGTVGVIVGFDRVLKNATPNDGKSRAREPA